MRFLLILLSLLFSANVWAVDLFEPVGFLTDKADIFSEKEESQLTDLIRSVEEKTTAEIAILTVKTTNGIPIFDYALETAEKWGIGKKDTENGLFILISVYDREYQILTGYGLEGILPDVRIDQIARKNFPLNFRSGEYFKGLSAALTDVEGLLLQDPTIISKYDRTSLISNFNEKASIIFFVGMVLLFVLNLWKVFNNENQIERTAIASVLFGIFVGIILPSILTGIVIAFFFFIFGNLRGTSGRGSFKTDGFGNGGFGGGSFGGFGGGGFGGGGASGKW